MRWCARRDPSAQPRLRITLAPQHYTRLRERPFVQATPDGLLLHDLARETFLNELRARDPDLYETLLDRALSYLLERLEQRPPGREMRLYTDALYLVRHEPGARLMHVGELGDLYLDDPALDRDPITDVVHRHEGARAATIAEHWLGHDAASWVVLGLVPRASNAAPSPVRDTVPGRPPTTLGCSTSRPADCYHRDRG